MFLFPGLKEVHFFNEVHLERQGDRHKTRIRNLGRLERRFEAADMLTPEAQATIDRLRSDPRDDAWYAALFSLAPPEKLAGEITPAYSMLPPSGIQHMLRLNPEVRLILLLRHPVERAWSHVRFELRRNWFTEHDEAPPEDLLRQLVFQGNNRRRTDYKATIQTYRGEVPSDQLLIGFYDDIVQRPDQLLADVATFLGVDPKRYRQRPSTANPRPNAAPSVPMPPGLREELSALYADDIVWLSDHVDGVPTSWRDA